MNTTHVLDLMIAFLWLWKEVYLIIKNINDVIYTEWVYILFLIVSSNKLMP